MKLVNCQQEEMSRDIINTVIKKMYGVPRQYVRGLSISANKVKGTHSWHSSPLIPLVVQKHFPVFVLQTDAWPLHLQAVEQRGGKKKEAMLNEARETDWKAIKSFRCQTAIHQQLKCTWKLYWSSGCFQILRAAKNRTVCQHGGSAGCRTDVLYEITIQLGFFFSRVKNLPSSCVAR